MRGVTAKMATVISHWIPVSKPTPHQGVFVFPPRLFINSLLADFVGATGPPAMVYSRGGSSPSRGSDARSDSFPWPLAPF